VNTLAELTRIMGHKNRDSFFNDPFAINPANRTVAVFTARPRAAPQDELMRQQRDLHELMAADLRDVSTLAQKIRQRAKAESIGVFNNGS
jgi:hypothetical protein